MCSVYLQYSSSSMHCYLPTTWTSEGESSDDSVSVDSNTIHTYSTYVHVATVCVMCIHTMYACQSRYNGNKSLCLCALLLGNHTFQTFLLFFLEP